MNAIKTGALALLMVHANAAVGTDAVVGANTVAGVEAESESESVIPVLWQTPGCKYERLGVVSAQAGREVDPQTRDLWMPSADYDQAFAKLAEAGQQRGGNAVVLRWHQATFFTRNRRRSSRPVHVELKGAVIRLADGGQGCELERVDPRQVEARALKGEPVDVTPEPGANAG